MKRLVVLAACAALLAGCSTYSGASRGGTWDTYDTETGSEMDSMPRSDTEREMSIPSDVDRNTDGLHSRPATADDL